MPSCGDVTVQEGHGGSINCTVCEAAVSGSRRSQYVRDVPVVLLVQLEFLQGFPSGKDCRGAVIDENGG